MINLYSDFDSVLLVVSIYVTCLLKIDPFRSVALKMHVQGIDGFKSEHIPGSCVLDFWNWSK